MNPSPCLRPRIPGALADLALGSRCQGSAGAAALGALPPAGYLVPDSATPAELRRVAIADYVTDLRQFLGQPTALDDGAIAFANRTVGNLARPFFPDGIAGTRHGPLSKPAGQWSPFSTGLQLDLGYNWT